MFAFDYHAPATVETATALVRNGEDAKFLAGGQTLIPTLKQRLAAPSDLVDLRAVAVLKGIEVTSDAVTIGAMTPHADVAASAKVKAAIPALAELASLIGDPAVRNLGTIGGSLANNDPSADYPAACIGLGAAIVTDRREIAADDFFLGLFETALEADEMIVRVVFPRVEAAVYAKFPNPASRYAMAGAFVARGASGVRVAITGAGGNGVFRWREAEAALAEQFSPDALAGLSLSDEGMIADIHGSGEYRAHLAAVMTRRAVGRLAPSRV